MSARPALDHLPSGLLRALVGLVLSEFPVTAEPIGVPTGSNSGLNAFVRKIDGFGSAIVHSRTIGGNGLEYALAASLDDAGSLYIAGVTTSADFPTLRPMQSEYSGDTPNRMGDAFVAKFGPDGSLVYSTFLGGSDGDAATGIAVGRGGVTYVTGQTLSTDFPTRNAPGGDPDPDPVQGCDTFAAALEPDGSSLRYSAYFRGSEPEVAGDVAVDSEHVA